LVTPVTGFVTPQHRPAALYTIALGCSFYASSRQETHAPFLNVGLFRVLATPSSVFETILPPRSVEVSMRRAPQRPNHFFPSVVTERRRFSFRRRPESSTLDLVGVRLSADPSLFSFPDPCPFTANIVVVRPVQDRVPGLALLNTQARVGSGCCFRPAGSCNLVIAAGLVPPDRLQVHQPLNRTGPPHFPLRPFFPHP